MTIAPFQIEIDKVDKAYWDSLMNQFDDASICQTWSYGTAKKRSVSHVVIKRGADILGCCQVEIRNAPFYKIGIADIHWGPLCVKKDGIFNHDVLYYLVRAIKEEYAMKRGYFLRIWPHATKERKDLLKQILESEGFKKNISERPYRSLRIDLSPSINDLRKDLLPRWRSSLNNAERNNLTLIEGTDIELFNVLVRLSKEVARIKKFTDLTDYEIYRRAQNDLPDQFKIRFVICESQGEPVCAVGYSAIGDTAEYILAGTGKKAYELNATYLAQWRMVERLKENGVRYFDLGPFNPERNPGVYRFKLGLAGKKGWEEVFLGEYNGCFNISAKVAREILKYTKRVKGMMEDGNRHE